MIGVPVSLASSRAATIAISEIERYVFYCLANGKWWLRELEEIWCIDEKFSIREVLEARLSFPLIRLFAKQIEEVLNREHMVWLCALDIMLRLHDHNVSLSLLSHTPVVSMFHLKITPPQGEQPAFSCFAFADNKVALLLPLVLRGEDEGVKGIMPLGGYFFSEVFYELLLRADYCEPHEPLQTMVISLPRCFPAWEGCKTLARWSKALETPGGLNYEIDLPPWVVEEISAWKLLAQDTDPQFLFELLKERDTEGLFAPLLAVTDE